MEANQMFISRTPKVDSSPTDGAHQRERRVYLRNVSFAFLRTTMGSFPVSFSLPPPVG
jgi:hypothetical protein